MENEAKDYVTNVTVNGLKCIRCEHEWIPRKPNTLPLTCPNCHSAYWSRKPIRAKKVVEEKNADQQ